VIPLLFFKFNSSLFVVEQVKNRRALGGSGMEVGWVWEKFCGMRDVLSELKKLEMSLVRNRGKVQLLKSYNC
jgi:hypothetical protein